MHRLKQSLKNSWLVCLSVIILAFAASGCAGQKAQVRDPAHVEKLRLKITKVRNAVVETRSTIALSRGAPYLPELYIRLAELLSEEARYHYQLAYERQQRSSRTLHVPQVRVLKEEAITIYQQVLTRFPDSPLVPRALFNIGHEHRELGNFDEMRKAFQKLVDNHKKSPLRYDALLVLGDYHFDHQELDKAKDYYGEITKGEVNKLSGLGHYKRAWVYVNWQDCKRALADFEAAMDTAAKWDKEKAKAGNKAFQTDEERVAGAQGATQQDIDVRRESLVDSIYCYSRLKPSKRAVPYMRKRAYNRATYIAALDKAANRYRVMDKADGALAATRELLRLAPASEDRLDDARTLYTSLKKTKRFGNVAEDMRLIANALIRYYNRVEVQEEVKIQLVEEFELFMRDLATTAQAALSKANAEKKAEQAQQVAAAYEIYVDTFPEGEKLPEMLLNMSDVLSIGGLHFDSGMRSTQAADLLDEGEERDGALYDAVVSFQKSLERESDRQQFERVAARAALRRAAAKLLESELEADKSRRVKYALAQAYFDEGRFMEAIDMLGAVAHEYPNSEQADSAIHHVLDSYFTLNDYDGLMYTGRRYLADGSPVSEKMKGEIKPIVAAAEQKKLDELSLKAAGEDGSSDLKELEEFAEANKGTDLGERALLNAFVAARAVGDTGKMRTLADSLTSTYPKSDQLPGIFSTLAQTAVARFEYDQAVETLIQAADANPGQKAELLAGAGDLLEQLGDVERAKKVYLQALGSAQGPEKIQTLARYSALIERQGDPRRTIKDLQPFMDAGSADVIARIGLAQVATGDNESAEQTLESVLNVDTGATQDAEARVHFGNAEILLAALKSYPEPDSIELLEEFIAIIDVVEEGYINAARQGTPNFAAAALSRLSHAYAVSAGRLRKIKAPPDFPAEEKEGLLAAMSQRAENMDEKSKQAVDACAQQAWSNRILSPVVRECLKGKGMEGGVNVPFDSLKNRGGKKAVPGGAAGLIEQLSKNPEDVDGLKELGTMFLDANDPHVARLIFARAVAAGGGPEVQNLLGVASANAGDISGAFEAFSQAAGGGQEAGRQNLKKLLQQNGLAEAAKQVDERFTEGQPGGRLL